MMANSCKLLRFAVFRVVRVQNSFGGPNSYIAIYYALLAISFRAAHRTRFVGVSVRTSSGGNKALSIGGDVAAIYLVIFQVA